MYTHSYSFNTDICLHIHSAECTVRLLNQAGKNNYPYNPKYVGNTKTQKYRSESDLVIWLLLGFEDVIVQVTDRKCPLAHMRSISIALAWLAAFTE